jgi:hypothetical protein
MPVGVSGVTFPDNGALTVDLGRRGRLPPRQL